MRCCVPQARRRASSTGTPTDWATAIMHPGDPAVMAAVGETMRAGVANSLSGRQLPGPLAKAGLVVEDIGSQALVQDRSAATGPMMTHAGPAGVRPRRDHRGGAVTVHGRRGGGRGAVSVAPLPWPVRVWRPVGEVCQHGFPIAGPRVP